MKGQHMPTARIEYTCKATIFSRIDLEIPRGATEDEVDMYDIQVDHSASNFVIDGMIVHNSLLDGSRKAFKQLRLMEDAALIYRICVRGDTKVRTVDGYKKITDIEIGDVAYCLDRDGEIKETKIVNNVCNGKDKIYKVYSRHREIYANATHPILVVDPYKKNGIMCYDRLKYVDVKDLKTRHNTANSAYAHRFLLPRIESKNHVKLKFPAIPKYARVKQLASVGVSNIVDGIKNTQFFTDELEIVDTWSHDNMSDKCHSYNVPECATEDCECETIEDKKKDNNDQN